MTLENQRLRDCLKTTEHIIVAALASQPDDDERCRQHLQKACNDAREALGQSLGEKE